MKAVSEVSRNATNDAWFLWFSKTLEHAELRIAYRDLKKRESTFSELTRENLRCEQKSEANAAVAVLESHSVLVLN